MDWFKTYQDGILRGSLSEVSETTQLIWLKLLAIENETRLRDGWLHYSPGRPMTREYLAMVCHVSIESFNLAIQDFLGDVDRDGCARVEIGPDGDIFIKNWEKYQAKPEKTIAQKVAIEKGKETKRRQQTIMDGLMRQLNQLNKGLSAQRYEATKDGKILDKQTGEVTEPKSVD